MHVIVARAVMAEHLLSAVACKTSNDWIWTHCATSASGGWLVATETAFWIWLQCPPWAVIFSIMISTISITPMQGIAAGILTEIVTPAEGITTIIPRTIIPRITLLRLRQVLVAARAR
jgi:hypothetical protein